MQQLKNIHPGEILLEEFLIPLEISAYRLSKDIAYLKPEFQKFLNAEEVLRLIQL